MFDAHFDPTRRRLSVCYSGFWSDADIQVVLARFTTQIAAAGAGGAFTLLEDFRDFSVQSPSVIGVATSFVEIIDASPISRYAMVIESALLRAQFRRQQAGRVPHEVFGSTEEAARWLSEVEPRA